MATKAAGSSETAQDSAPESLRQGSDQLTATQGASSLPQGASPSPQNALPRASSTASSAPSAEGLPEFREDDPFRSPAGSDVLGQEVPRDSASTSQERGKMIHRRGSAAEGDSKQKNSSGRSSEPSSIGSSRFSNAVSQQMQTSVPYVGSKGAVNSSAFIPQPSVQPQRDASQGGFAVKSATGKYAVSPSAEVNGSLRRSSVASASSAPMPRTFPGESSSGGGGTPAKPGFPLGSTNVKGSLWQQLLYEARSSKTPEKPKGYIIVLGSQDAGKSALLRQLQMLGSSKPLTPIEMYTNTGGVSLVDYAYVGDRMLAEPDDIHTVDAQDYVNVYILQNADMSDHLARRLPPAAVTSLCFLICLDVKQAWCAMDELERWKNVAERIANHLISQRDLDVQDALLERTQRYLANYRKGLLSTGVTRAATVILELQHLGSNVSPTHKTEEKGEAGTALQQQQTEGEITSSSSSGAGGGAAGGGGSALLLPVPAVVCLTRSDYFASLNSNPAHAGEADVIIAYLRRACLSFNAALIACSCKDPSEPKNVFLLYRYLLHRLYNYSFKEPPYLKDPEELFIPAGCDTSDAIEEAVRRTVAGNFERPYEEWITRVVEPMAKVGEAPGGRVVVQTSQEFLREMQEQHPSAVVAGKTFKQQQQAAGGSAAALDVAASSVAEGFSHEPVAGAAGAGGGAAAAGGRGAAAAGGAAGAAGVSAAGSIRTFSSTGSSKGLRTPAAAEGRTSRAYVAAASAKTKPRITVSGSTRSVASSSIAPSISSASTATALQQPSASGESPSLQNFFQGLLAKSKAKASPAPRERSRARSKAPAAAAAAPAAKGTLPAEKQQSPPADE